MSNSKSNKVDIIAAFPRSAPFLITIITIAAFLYSLSLNSLQMSPISVKSPKHCAYNPSISSSPPSENTSNNISKPYKKIFYTFSTILLSILLVIFLVWVILHPSKPEFFLQEADIYNNANISSPPRLFNSSIQFTLLSKNPNKKVGIYYDALQVCASYKGRQITNDTSLPPFYQEHKEINLLSTNFVQKSTLVGPTGEEIVLILTANGRLRWKVGTWVTGSYKFKVQCLATINYGPSLSSSNLKQGDRCLTSM